MLPDIYISNVVAAALADDPLHPAVTGYNYLTTHQILTHLPGLSRSQIKHWKKIGLITQDDDGLSSLWTVHMAALIAVILQFRTAGISLQCVSANIETILEEMERYDYYI